MQQLTQNQKIDLLKLSVDRNKHVTAAKLQNVLHDYHEFVKVVLEGSDNVTTRLGGQFDLAVMPDTPKRRGRPKKQASQDLG